MTIGRVILVAGWLGSVVLSGCAQHPLPLMDGYLGSPVMAAPAQRAAPLTAGLLLVNDTSAQQSAPALSERAKAFLTHQVRERVEAATPIRVGRVLGSGNGPVPHDREALVRMAQDQGLTYLLIALFSSGESEVPAYLPLTGDPEQGGSRPNIPGYEAVNYALVELALIDAASGQVIARSDGRAWARLNRLNMPMASNAYPVIHRSLRPAPIYPPEADAKDVLRSLAADEALEQAATRLQEAWPKS